jgi:APA family basic amino acid/polyamine antiporter
MSTDTSRLNLVRGLTLWGTISVVIGTVIGTGVFLKARVMTCNVESPMMVLGAWVAAGVLSLAGTLTYGELAAMLPEAGGEYVFLREGYGPRLAFVYGWAQSVIVFPASEAAKGVAFALFLNVLTHGGLERTYFTAHLFGHDFSFGQIQLIALATVFVVTAINCAAVSVSDKILSFLTALKVLFVFGIGIAAFLIGKGSMNHLSMTGSGVCEGVAASARGGWAGFGAAMLGALWAYDGWVNVTLAAGEVKNPSRNLPIALIGGMSCILVLYLLINSAYFYILTPSEVASVSPSSSVATETMKRFLGPASVGLITAGLLMSTLGSLYNGILAGARIPFAMARDGRFFSALGNVSKNTRVPVNALIVQWLWISLLTVSGSFDALTDYAMFAAWIFYGLVTSSVFIFRKKRPDAPRPYRTVGYPIIPVLFILTTACLLVTILWSAPRQSLFGLALIAAGIPLYNLWRGRA